MNAEQMRTETESSEAVRPSLRRRVATSQGRLARMLRWAYRAINNFAMPAPSIVVKPLLWLFLLVRNIYYFAARVFICEPLFKAYCTKYGRNLHTDCHLHRITGKGDIIIGDNVTLDGKCIIEFAARFSDHPTLKIGNN